MKQRLFRAVSLVLALALLVCLVPAVYAEDLDSSQESGPTEETTGLGRELEAGDALVPLSSLYSNARSGGTITVTAEPSWYCGDFQYGVYDALSGYPDTMVFNKGNYWVNDFSYFVLSNGQIGYCIQPYKPGTTGTYTPNMNWGGLTYNRQKGVGLAFLYGAPNNGNTTQADYIATAAVVRDMACGYRMADTSFTTNGDTGAAFTSSPFREKLRASYPEAYTKYQEILAAIAKHGTIPSFTSRYKSAIGEAQTVKLKLNQSTGLYEASVTDTNGVLAYFNYSSSLAGVTFTRSGNTLNITATKEAAKSLTGGVTISGRGFEFSDPQDVCTVWTADPSTTNGGSTQLIAVMDAATDPVPSYFKIVAEDVEAEVSVVKTSTDGKVDGITFSVKNNTTGVTTTQTTANGGRFSFKATVGDSVTITEHVPEGYVNTAASQTITVAAGGNTVTFSNVLRQGTITVTKTGEVFSSVIQREDKTYQPVYREQPLSGAVFEIRAAEDIYAPDGTRIHAAGDPVEIVTTGADGTATSKLLYLGKYTVTEAAAPDGYFNAQEEKAVELACTGVEGAVVTAGVTFHDQRQKASLRLSKTLEADEAFGILPGDEITSVTFGLYAAQTLTAADGKTIPADGLLEVAACDEDGKLTFSTDIPVGAKLYVQEISTDEKYVLSDGKYPVEFTYAGQDAALVEIPVNGGEAITNDLIRGTIVGKKIDEDGFTICGATFGLFRQYETVFTEETALLTTVSNEIGVFGFVDVPFGNYIVRELKPAPAFVLNETLYGVTVDEDGETVEITVENKFLTGTVKTVKVGADNPEATLSGAVFEIYVDVDGNQVFDADIDILVGTMPEVQTGTYCMDNLRYGGYFIHEKTAPEGYLQDDGYYYFTIREDGEVVTVESKAGVGFVNTLIRGSVAGKKVDNTGKGLAGAVIGLFPADAKVFTTDAALMTAVSAEDGSFSFDEVPYGAYIVREIKAPEGYILTDKSYNITIHADGELIRVEIPNSPEPVVPTTGDTGSILLWFLLLTLSAAGAAVMLRVMQRRWGW